MKKTIIGLKTIICLLASVASAVCIQANTPTDIQQKADSILATMSLEQKIGQMNQLNCDAVDDALLAMAARGEVGSILNAPSLADINRLQQAAMEGCGVPIVFARDVIHGYHTIFPIPLGQAATFNPAMFELTPDKAGEYTVEVNITTGEDAAMIPVTRNVSRAASTCVTAQVKVVCVEASEQQRLRPRTGSSSPYSTRVFEWTPAPGQFIGENGPGWMMGNESTLEAANAWAESRLDSEKLVSLGAFGGYIIVGFDHSIVASGGEYDFAVAGNAFLNAQGGSNEPGIVWVMQDVNGNGLPDDEWYELKGSETGKSATLQNYYVTYFRPEAPQMDVEWIDSEGNTGTVKYLPLLHKQDYYYPAWISASSYTLYGTRISAKNSADPTTGFWNNAPYEWPIM